jgi:hypothetical protein
LNEAHLVSYAYAGSLSDDRTLQLTEVCHQLIRYDSGQRFPTKVWGRNIRKAESNHLIHVEDMPIDVFVAALELELNQKGNPYSKKDYTRLSKIIMMTKAAGIGFLKGIKNNQGSFICGQFYVYNNHQLYLVACFSDAEAKLHSALHYLMYTLVKNNFSHQLVVHFGGSTIPVIADFNKNFGAVDERYVKVVKKNILFTLLNKLI